MTLGLRSGEAFRAATRVRIHKLNGLCSPPLRTASADSLSIENQYGGLKRRKKWAKKGKGRWAKDFLVAVTNYLKLSGLNYTNLLSYTSGSRKYKRNLIRLK